MPLLNTSGNATADAYAGGVAAVTPVYIEDVMSTFLYTGNGSTQTINNGIDLAGKGGLVWTHNRSNVSNQQWQDTNQGLSFYLTSDSNDQQSFNSGFANLSAFNTNGFSVGTSLSVNNESYVSWSIRKQPKFFDIQTWSGNGANRTISHNLGSVPGCIIVKRLNAAGTAANWQVYHRSLANTQYMVLNTDIAVATGANRWNSTTPTSSVFSLGTDASVNASGGTYIAYIFAHDAAGFGLNGTDNAISCGTFTSTGAAQSVNLGYEPQWLMIKRVDVDGSWWMVDNMRGWVAGPNTNSKYLAANSASSEGSWPSVWEPTATGFNATLAASTYIYIAIRRGPMKVPKSGTSVFSPVARTGTGTSTAVTTPNFSPDMLLQARRGAPDWPLADRLRGASQNLATCYTSAENTPAYVESFDMTGATLGSQNAVNGSGLTYIEYFFRRAPSFFDEVCYTGTGTTTTQTHNLQAVPELIIVKRRSASSSWQIYSATYGRDYYAFLNLTQGFASDPNNSWGTTNPTSTTFGLSPLTETNTSGNTYVAYLFATCAGVSKVGSYTGTGATQTINCGFTGGARFVLIKRGDLGGAWYVWDTARGMVSGTDPSILLNSTAAEVNADSIYTTTGGFEIVSTAAGINLSGGTYIYLAIA